MPLHPADARRFLFVMWDGGGTVPPELAVARRLIGRGHHVRVLGDPTLEAEARAAGCAFSPWTTAPHRKSRARADDIVKDYAFSNPLTMLDTYLREFLAGPAPRWTADTLAELTVNPVDALVVDFAIPAALIAGERLGLPCATLMPNIWIIPTPGIPPMGPGFMPARGPIGRIRDWAMRTMTNRLFARALPSLNAVREAHGLPRVTNVYDQLLGADEILVQTSPIFDLTSPAMPSHVRYVGPELADPEWAERWQSPFASGDARPLVRVGLSSTFQNQVSLLGRIVSALASLPVRGLITLGPTLSPSEVAGASNVVVVSSAPHAQVLNEASLLITHCGHGTTMKGLAAGVPLVCIPMGRDQNDTAARVVHRGAGVRLAQDAAAGAIAAAVQTVLSQASYREGARRLASAIASHEGCVDAVESLERLALRRLPATPLV